MNLEEYKSQMEQRYPNTAFVEETLQNLKNNRSKLRIPVKKIGKAVGGISLLAAAAFAILVGAGTIRGLLSEVSITEQNPEEENAILADREALFMTPLSNPDHTVRIDTENGKVAMNENTTAEEIVACGGVIDSNFGFVGYERICNFLRAYRNGEKAELVIAELPNEYRPDRRSYQYIGLNEDGTVKGKYYLHEGERLSTFPFERVGTTRNGGIGFGYCAATSSPKLVVNSRSTVAGMAIDLSSYGRGISTGAWDLIPICTISDLLRVSERSGDTIREEYFSVLSNLGEKSGVNILWNGQYSSPSQLKTFLSCAKSGTFPYCSTTVTDLTKTDEYEECFYALEYLDGEYRIFTMKNGFEGEFDTAYFDGWTVKDNTVIFDNGSVEYRFPFPYEGTAFTDFSESNTTEVCTYNRSLMGGSNWVVRDGGGASYDWCIAFYSDKGFTLFEGETRFEPLFADPNYFAIFAADPRNCVTVSEEYSEGELLAVEILDQYETSFSYGDYTTATVATPEKTGKIEFYKNTTLLFPSEYCDIREMPDGKSYLMITGKQWREMSIKATSSDEKIQRLSLFVHYYEK